MRPVLFTIERAGPGRLSTMARPRAGDWLAEEIADLARSGVSVLVSLLSAAEAAELELGQEEELARAAGLAWYALPTTDRSVPDRAASLSLARTLRSHLDHGASVAIHCRNGIGRASVLTAIILVLEGAEPGHAWEQISAARGLSVPDTSVQRDAVASLRPQL